jgi:hypothetical protein
MLFKLTFVMKKTFVLISFLILALQYSFAANDEDKKSGGIRAGFHSASMMEKGSKPDTANSLNNFYVGLYGDKKIAPALYLGTGIEYFQNGLKYPGDSKRVLHTVSVPVDLKLKLGPVFALGGVAANFIVSEKLSPGDNNYTPADNSKSNWFDVPVFVGAGLKVLFLTVEARYHWGLLEAREGLYNRYFQIGAAISF